VLFNSFEFLLFFPLVVVLQRLLPPHLRWGMLLVASYVFYMAWAPAYGLLLFASTALDWYVGTRLPHAQTLGARRAWLSVSLTGNLGMLFAFKYYNLVNGTLTELASWLGYTWPLPETGWLLPVGISFYTFQTMSYAIDVYRGTLPPEPNLARFALYVSYFPQLVAGPIERATRLLPQLNRSRLASADEVVSGLRLAAWGLFKKVVVADRLGVLVDAVYAEPTAFNGFALIMAMLFFCYQVYGDFSGYSDVAIGVARVLGVDLMRNFDQPHGSRSMSEWWNRWHISLSTWFRDYVYFPLGGSQIGFWGWARNITIVFLISGIWHGASWKFAVWGLMHAVLVVGDRATRPLRDGVARALGVDSVPGLRPAIQIVSTFVLWAFTLVPFRADTLSEAVYVMTHLGTGWTRFGELGAFGLFLSRVHLDLPTFLWCLLLMPIVEVVDWARRQPGSAAWWDSLPFPVRWAADYAMIFSVLALGYWADTPFVYFQF
jgi:alginate O-acetyltransferase complex protein AlgI